MQQQINTDTSGTSQRQEKEPSLMVALEELFKVFEAACCSSSSMSKELPEGMSTLPQAQGCHNELPDGAVPTNVPGMPTQGKPSEEPATSASIAPAAPVAPRPPTPAAPAAPAAPIAPVAPGTPAKTAPGAPAKTSPLAPAKKVPVAPPAPGTSSTAEPDAEAGELPDIGVEDDKAEEEDGEFTTGQFTTQDMPAPGVEGDASLSAEQQKQAKAVIKDFVKEMVKGRKITVISKAGAIKQVSIFLGRKLDSFKIQAGNNTRKIPLTDISDLHIGQDGPSIDTPLDDLCCTMALVAGECLTFRFSDITARDTFAMCMLMFVNGARGNG